MKRILLTLLAAVSVSLMAAAKTDLSKYVIVYPASAEAEEGLDIAEAVASAVEASTGVRLPVVSDETPEVRREILIGKTSRKESAAFYAVKPDTFDYALSVRGNKILVQGGGCWALMKALRALESGVPKKPVTGNIYGEPVFDRAKGTNLRILDDNIWQYDSDKNAPAWEKMGLDCTDAVRCRGFAELVWATTPDIVTLQEYSAHMDKYLYPSRGDLLPQIRALRLEQPRDQVLQLLPVHPEGERETVLPHQHPPVVEGRKGPARQRRSPYGPGPEDDDRRRRCRLRPRMPGLHDG